MVKRTVVVLGILSLMLMAAGSSFAFMGWGGGCGEPCSPLYVPADCPPVPGFKTIVKTWEAKVEGPCPAPMGGCCPEKSSFNGGLLCQLATAIATPLDWVFGGIDGVYGCFGGLGGGDSACGPFLGPLPCAVAALPLALASPTVMFETLW